MKKEEIVVFVPKIVHEDSDVWSFVYDLRKYDAVGVFCGETEEKSNGEFEMHTDPKKIVAIIVTNKLSEDRDYFMPMASEDGMHFRIIVGAYLNGKILDVRELTEVSIKHAE